MVSANQLEVWIEICGACEFVSIPEGFDKLTGMDNRMRHRLFGNLNPGVFMPKIVATFKVNGDFSSIHTAMIYTCANCGAGPFQAGFVYNAHSAYNALKAKHLKYLTDQCS
jgi:hypothetical protein